MKGRRPIPEAVRALRGMAAHARPAADAVSPYCPRHLDGIAREEWRRVAPLLTRRGLLTPSDTVALEAYCQQYAAYRACQEIVAKEGLIVQSPKGPTLHPAARHAQACLKEIRAFAVEFGCTPSSRGRMELPPAPDPEKDEFDAFLDL
jgi:P27 family predicted phage terminase small subunit